jgi:NADH:ubiquinone oxidoreductase subunit F (NADH-binding)
MSSSLPRLLAGVGEQPVHTLSGHLAVHGPMPEVDPAGLIAAVEEAGLRGHGGAAFPAAVKLRAVAARRGAKVLVANGTEGEPASKKDRVLLRSAPHLVLDGAAAAARAIGTREAIIAISELDRRGRAAIEAAVRERSRGHGEPQWQIVSTPERFITGQESALVNFLSGGPGVPTFGPRPFQRGVRGRPTLVQNVETLAHLALIARHGPAWFRGLGTPEHPGSAMLTICGGVQRPGVYEIEHGMALSELLRWVDGGPTAGVLVGGYFGSWLGPDELDAARLDSGALAGHGAALGAGVIAVLPQSACPVAETARVCAFFSAESAGQCGPCLNGLGAIRDTVAAIASGHGSRADIRLLERWTGDLRGRGACQHPDGAVRFLASALRVFGSEFHEHAVHGPCSRCRNRPVLPVPGYVTGPAALAA